MDGNLLNVVNKPVDGYSLWSATFSDLLGGPAPPLCCDKFSAHLESTCTYYTVLSICICLVNLHVPYNHHLYAFATHKHLLHDCKCVIFSLQTQSVAKWHSSTCRNGMDTHQRSF